MKASLLIMMAVLLAACATSPPLPEPGPERLPEAAPPTVEADAIDDPQAQVAHPEPSVDPDEDPPEPSREQADVAGVEADKDHDGAGLDEPAPALVTPSTPAATPAVRPGPPPVASAPADAATRPSAAPQAATERAVLSGTVRVSQQGRAQPFAATFLAQTVMAWRPAAAARPEPMPEQQLVTRQSRFFPQTMAVTSGTVIRFPNMDSIQHNVYSLTAGHQFDVGLYGAGEGRTHRFDGSGLVEVFCNVHPNMAAFLLVLDTAHFVNPDEHGAFRLDDLPLGEGELLVWNYRTDEQLLRIPLRLGLFNDPVDIAIDITRPAVPQRTNKHGEPFRRR